MVKKVYSSLRPRGQKHVPSSTVSDGGSERYDIVAMILGNISEFIVVEVVERLDGTPVMTVIPVVTDPVGRSSH